MVRAGGLLFGVCFLYRGQTFSSPPLITIPSVLTSPTQNCADQISSWLNFMATAITHLFRNDRKLDHLIFT
jgi:hypothetical protein